MADEWSGMYRDVLVATDGSEGARRAADHAIDLAEGMGATVHGLSVAKEFEARDQLRARPQREAAGTVTYVEHEAKDRGVEVTTAVRSGDPCESIVAYAGEVDADVIVMGSASESGIGRLLKGSVANCVHEKATVPVLIVNEAAGDRLSTPEDADVRFECPECGEVVHMSETTKRGFLDRGCIMCGSAVTADAFETNVEVTDR